MSPHELDIADFTTTPGPRYIRQGPFSGEAFYKEMLRPAFEEHRILVIKLDRLEGYSPSFFEEAFGGLVRDFGYERVVSSLRFETAHMGYLVRKIHDWMKQAHDSSSIERTKQ